MNQFNNFWLCELKNGSYCPLVSYRTIGELLSVEGFVNNTFYLKQYLFDP